MPHKILVQSTPDQSTPDQSTLDQSIAHRSFSGAGAFSAPPRAHHGAAALCALIAAQFAVQAAVEGAAAHDPVTGAHGDEHADRGPHARYIANEGVLIVDGDLNVLFDPLFHDSYGQYRTPSPADRAAMLSGAAPFDGVDAVFISHAHGDHFAADDAVAYLTSHTRARLVAPAQAVDAMQQSAGWDEALRERIDAVALEFGDAPATLNITADGRTIAITAVRIPHAGWPGRAEVQNMVYRVSLGETATVMHLGDADPDDDHYVPFENHWAARETDIGFPPYWFLGSDETRAILTDRLRINRPVGVHVPAQTPANLETLRDAQGVDFFAIPGETRPLHPHDDGEHHE